MKPLFSTCCQSEATPFASQWYCTDCKEPCEVYDPENIEEDEPQPPMLCKNCGHPVNKFEDFCAACLLEEDDFEPDNENAHEDYERIEARKRSERFK